MPFEMFAECGFVLLKKKTSVPGEDVVLKAEHFADYVFSSDSTLWNYFRHLTSINDLGQDTGLPTLTQ